MKRLEPARRVLALPLSLILAMPADATVYNNTNPARATIWLSGNGLSGGDSLIAKPVTSGSSYTALLKLTDKNEVLGVYDISLKSGKTSSGSGMHLSFSIGAGYAGQAFTLVHQKADGSFEYFYATADVSGNVKFGPLFSLSPFMLMKGTLWEAALTRIPQTGDNFSPLPFALLAIAALCGAGVVYRRKRRAPRR